MTKFLDTRGKSSLAIAICDRCKRKFPWVDLMPDPNFPGLRVCRDDLDELDPYRLPMRPADQITLQWTRPDESIANNPLGLITQDSVSFILCEDGVHYLIP